MLCFPKAVCGFQDNWITGLREVGWVWSFPPFPQRGGFGMCKVASLCGKWGWRQAGQGVGRYSSSTYGIGSTSYSGGLLIWECSGMCGAEPLKQWDCPVCEEVSFFLLIRIGQRKCLDCREDSAVYRRSGVEEL